MKKMSVTIFAAITLSVGIIHAADTVPFKTGTITLESLLDEMVDRDSQARSPEIRWKSLQASSYNRESVARDKPGWFADSDGISCIRTEEINGKTEWVIMEHDGPGCITKMWTPFFYYSFGDLVGPNIRIYLDGSDTPVVDEGFIELLTRNEWPKSYGKPPQQRNSFQVPSPFSDFTARAGNLYLPVPFAKSCKITLTSKAFYNIINYRGYPEGTAVESFTMERYRAALKKTEATAQELLNSAEPNGASRTVNGIIEPSGNLRMKLEGGGAIRKLEIQLDPQQIEADPSLLRSTVVTMTFDNEQTVWCPLGDFFGSANKLNLFNTWTRTVTADGKMLCRWMMPYREGALVELRNLGKQAHRASLSAVVDSWKWDPRSMYFHASWRSDDIQPGNILSDWNFIDIQGEGVLIGDQWTVLSPSNGWWGEGDEKIYVDVAWDQKFPTHFGTGTEDYYGWAGGRTPTKQDVFSTPFLANISVGSTSADNPRGFNICTRQRALDAIPFAERLRFDMEASPGTGIRKATDALGYSAVIWWYARPGATPNPKPLPVEAAKPIVTFEDLVQSVGQAVAATAPAKKIKGALEFENLSPSAKSPGLSAGSQRPSQAFNPDEVWSNGKHFFVAGRKVGDFVEFRFTERFKPVVLELYLTKSYDFGIVELSVNGKKMPEKIDLYAPEPVVTEPLRIGPVEPVDNAVTLRVELVGRNPLARGNGSYMGLDCVVLKDLDE